MNEHKRVNNIHPLFQAVTLLITMIIIGFLCFRFMDRFCALDLKPSIHLLSESEMDQLKEDEIDVGFSVTDLINFDTTQNEFVISGLISFLFNPKKISLLQVENFSFEKGVILSKLLVQTKNEGDKTLVTYDIKLSFKNNMYHGYFPFEDHRIFFVLDNKNITIDQGLFRINKENLIINGDTYISGWKYRSKNIFEGYTTSKISLNKQVLQEIKNPRIIFEMDFYHHSLRYLYLVILPLLLIFMIEMFSFSVDQKMYKDTLFQMSIVNIGALFAYRFVIQTIAPNVGYLTIADFLFLLFLSTSFITFVVNCTGFYLSEWQKKIACVSLQLYVIFAFICILEFWPKCSVFLYD